MNLSPFPRSDDVVQVDTYEVNVQGDVTGPVDMYSATFQGNDRPSLTAYGETVEGAVASLYNALVVEDELEREEHDHA